MGGQKHRHRTGIGLWHRRGLLGPGQCAPDFRSARTGFVKSGGSGPDRSGHSPPAQEITATKAPFAWRLLQWQIGDAGSTKSMLPKHTTAFGSLLLTAAMAGPVANGALPVAVPNASFESPATTFVNTYIDFWQKPPKPS